MHTLAPPSKAAALGSRHAIRSDIQGLRGLAVGLVVLYHAKLPLVPGGYVGVDVFFVISGFLITKHLSESLNRAGRIDFAEFYARRARRLLPAALVVICLTVLASALWLPPLQLRAVFIEAVASTFYAPNLLLAANGTNYLAETTPSMFQQYWSLGVEEQFYLVWPALLLAVSRVTKSRRSLVLALSVLMTLSFAGSVLVSQMNQPLAFFLLPTRAWEFGVGALLALALPDGLRLSPKVSAAISWAGLALVITSAALFGEETVYPGYAALAPVIGTGLVIVVGSALAPPQLNPLVTWRPLLFVGDLSYSLYLVHWPLLVLPQAAVGQARPLAWWTTAALALACLPAAFILYTYVERKLQSALWLTKARPRRTLVTVLVVSVLLAALLAGGQAATSRKALDSGNRASPTTVADPPASTPFVPSNLRPGLRSAESDVPHLYASGCHLDFTETRSDGCSFNPDGSPTIALFGDSHAAQWFPALETIARQHSLRLETYTKSSCPSVFVATFHNGSPYSACTQWREAVVRHLIAHPPALVVISNYGAPSTAGPRATAGWEAGLSATVGRLQPVTRVAVIADTPNLRQTPSICLSAHLDEAEACGLPRRAALDSPARAAERAAVAATGATMVDLTGHLCTQSFCPAIIGDTLVYRDAHHLTATYSGELSVALWDQIGPATAGGR